MNQANKKASLSLDPSFHKKITKNPVRKANKGEIHSQGFAGMKLEGKESQHPIYTLSVKANSESESIWNLIRK